MPEEYSSPGGVTQMGAVNSDGGITRDIHRRVRGKRACLLCASEVLVSIFLQLRDGDYPAF